MKLSIITCTYNSEKYLQECIDSVIAQDLNVEDYEHIFVDAYSTDSTKKIIEKYMKKYSNVRLIERKPKWVYNAMNEGIKEAKWEYIMCLNSDDYLEKNAMSRYLKFVSDTWNKDLYYWKSITIMNWNIVDISNKNRFVYTIWRIFFYLWGKALIGHWTVLLKRDVFFELGMFDETKKISSDYWFWLNILTNKKKYVFFPYVVHYFRIHENSLSTNWKNNDLTKNEDLYMQKKYLPRYKIVTSNFITKICYLKWKFDLSKKHKSK